MVATTRWRALGASVRGASHLRSGAPNQDALRIDTRDGTALAAVADGHGGARHFRSADGARLAVQAAHEALLALAPALVAAAPAQRAQLAAADLPRRIVERWSELATGDLSERPLSDGEIAAVEAGEGAEAADSVRSEPLLAYGATLLAALALPDSMVIVQLGDGDVLSVDHSGRTTRPVPRDERLLGSFTTSICRPGAEADFRSIVLDGDAARPALLILSTDGYANSFLSDADYLKVGADFLGLLRGHGAETVGGQLPAILEDASTHGSGDDITLAILAGDLATGPAAGERPRPAAGVSAVRRELKVAERRLSRQRAVIVALSVALVGGAAWMQRERLAALWRTPPAATPIGIVEQPVESGDSGVPPAAAGGAVGTGPGQPTAVGGNGGDKPGRGARGGPAKGETPPKGGGSPPREIAPGASPSRPGAEPGAVSLSADRGIAPLDPAAPAPAVATAPR
jgi:serine/threonine protein phosphatase PrpC